MRWSKPIARPSALRSRGHLGVPILLALLVAGCIGTVSAPHVHVHVREAAR
jgi:hypothetical protein